MKVSDMIDRFTILKLKNDRIKDQSIYYEYLQFKTEIDFLLNSKNKELPALVHQLLHINASIWDLESDLRNGKENTIPLDEIGKTAIKIRDLNKKRISIRNTIADIFQENHELKADHISGI